MWLWRLQVPVAGGVLLGAILPCTTPAQTQNPGLGLTDLPYANEVERAAAIANQTVFDALDAECNPSGVYDSDPSPVAPPPQTGCTAERFFVYLNARELVHTANEIRGGGATVASLGSNLEGLGLALRWTAAEEFAVLGSMATEFSNSQLSNLASRLNALRIGAAGAQSTTFYRLDPARDLLLASTDSPVVAEQDSADRPVETYSRWGGFLNGAFGYGKKQPTPLEDAFDFDGSELTFGVDRRLSNGLVVGGIFGLGDQAVDFDEAASKISVVDGTIDSEASSVILFAVRQSDRLNVSGSIGAQSLDYRIVRNIKYPSFNPEIHSTNSVAMSRPSAAVDLMTFNAGYAFTRGRLTFEPIANIEYVDIDIGTFQEERSINRFSDPTESKRFDLSVSEQKIESLDASVALRLQWVLTPRIGVVVPYAILEAHRQLRDNSRTITTGYAALEDILGSNTFLVPTDLPDDSFATAITGFSIVLRGARQRTAGGPIVGGLSAFAQFKVVSGLLYYDDRVLTGGFRYEF